MKKNVGKWVTTIFVCVGVIGMANIQADTQFKSKGLTQDNVTFISKRVLITKLFDIGAIKFGQFKLKTGVVSPIYIDLRRIISYPDMLQTIAQLLWHEIKDTRFNVMCGVPYGALPITTSIALLFKQPMIMPRKQAKEYGTKATIEGMYQQKDVVLVIEDIITSGGSVFETVDILHKEGLYVHDVAVFLDRQQGGSQRLEKKGMQVHAVFTLSDLLDHLYDEGKISESTRTTVKTFIQQNRFS